MTGLKTAGPSVPTTRGRAAVWRGLALPIATGLMLSVIFPPFSWWWLTPVALLPLVIASLEARYNKWTFLYIWLITTLYYLANLTWLSGITVAGYIALSIYCGLYLAGFSCLLRWVCRTGAMPIWLAAPILFTSIEFLRDHFLGGFPWFTLGVAFTSSLTVVQSAALFGAAGLSFLAAFTSGALAQGLLRYTNPSAARPHATTRIGYVLLAVAWCSVLWYGHVQLQHRHFQPGPRVAVLQQNIPQSIKDNNSISSQTQLFNSYYQLSVLATKLKPNLIAWPETMVPGFLNPSWLDQSTQWYAIGHGRRTLAMDKQFAMRLAAFSALHHTALLVGSAGVRFNRSGRIAQMQNIAVMFTPRRGELPHYYAKRHLVPFGEYVPFKKSAPWLHRLLLYFTPFGPNNDYSLTPGTSWHRFRLRVGAREYRFGVPICYEDAMSHPDRSFARPRHHKKGVDFLVTISNDGWYQSRAELLQHLQLDQIRAVENRVSIARSVNGGYCGFINPLGEIIKLAGSPGHHAFVSGVACAELPIDMRISLFSRIGDILPRATQMLSLLYLGILALAGWRKRRRRAAADRKSDTGAMPAAE